MISAKSFLSGRFISSYIDEALPQFIYDETGIDVYSSQATGDPPFIVVTKISGPREHDLQGPEGLATPTFQVSVFARTKEQAKFITRQIQSKLKGSIDMYGVKVRGIFYINEIDFYEDDTRLYHVASDYQIQHEE